MTIPNSNEMEALEALIDRVGMFETIVALSVICGDKAEHIRHNWQDKVTAKQWDTASNVLANTAKMPTIQKL